MLKPPDSPAVMQVMRPITFIGVSPVARRAHPLQFLDLLVQLSLLVLHGDPIVFKLQVPEETRISM